MSNIQKEVSQLEHWLNNLQEDTTNNPQTTDGQYEVSNLHRVIDRFSEQLGNQQLTLNNILERLDILEGFNRPEREIFINQNIDPWLDNNCEPLQNEIIANEDNISEPLYIKHNSTMSSKSSIATPSIIPNIPEDNSIGPDIDSDTESVIDAPTPNNSPISKSINNYEADEEEEEVEVEVVVEEEEKEEVEVVEEEVEVVEEEVEVVEEEEEEEEEEEVVEEDEEEEEEEGMELEEVEYKGIKYYKDAENFIYSIDSDDQPSENPIGFWKEKAQIIAFYKTK
jgi:hypothetical protein